MMKRLIVFFSLLNIIDLRKPTFLKLSEFQNCWARPIRIRSARRSLNPCSSVTHVQAAILKLILHLQLHAWAQIHCKASAFLSFPNHFRKKKRHQIILHHCHIFFVLAVLTFFSSWKYLLFFCCPSLCWLFDEHHYFENGSTYCVSIIFPCRPH